MKTASNWANLIVLYILYCKVLCNLLLYVFIVYSYVFTKLEIYIFIENISALISNHVSSRSWGAAAGCPRSAPRAIHLPSPVCMSWSFRPRFSLAGLQLP